MTQRQEHEPSDQPVEALPRRSHRKLRRAIGDFRTKFARRRSRGELASTEHELYHADTPADVTSVRAKSSRHGTRGQVESIAGLGVIRVGPGSLPSRETAGEAVELLISAGYDACEVDFGDGFWMDWAYDADALGELARNPGAGANPL